MTSMPMFSWHVCIWMKRCLPWKILLRPKACLLCKCLFVCLLLVVFFFFWLVVWDIVNNGIYAIDFSISFESLLCIIATAFCALNKKGKVLNVAICWTFTSHQKKGTPMLPELYDYFFLNTNAKTQAQICASRSNPFLGCSVKFV